MLTVFAFKFKVFVDNVMKLLGELVGVAIEIVEPAVIARV